MPDASSSMARLGLLDVQLLWMLAFNGDSAGRHSNFRSFPASVFSAP